MVQWLGTYLKFVADLQITSLTHSVGEGEGFETGLPESILKPNRGSDFQEWYEGRGEKCIL
jgi:hypothetical protein